ncbi:MAG: glycosyltransferase family 2 protein [Bdellovibrio sp.]
MKTVDIIIPCFNESQFISTMLNSVIQQDYPTDLIKIYVADGMSDDGTRAFLMEYQKKYANLFVIDNPHRATSFALNLALRSSHSEIVIRMDCHAYYPTNYISYLVENLERTGADNVGICLETMPANATGKSQGIAIAISVPIGVGNSMFRTGITQEREVDTVPFGCYWRTVFSRIGYFDEDLTRGQDSEFNSRLLKHGGRIVLLPGPRIRYFARDSFKKLSRMYYQYGLYKPFTNYKSKRFISWRQFVPSAFLVFLTSLLLIGFVKPAILLLLGACILFYEMVVFFFVARVAKRMGRATVGVILSAIWSINLLHFAYGFGFLRGFALLLAGQRPGNVKITR